MANYNLTNQTISSSFSQLLQKDTDTEKLVDGVGTPIVNLTISGSTTSGFFIGDGSQLTNIPHTDIPQGTISGSSQVDYPEISNIPAGIVSGSEQLPAGIISGSEQLPGGLVSGSSQVDYPEISNIPVGIVSGSSQVSYPLISNIPSGIISGSEQLPSGIISGSVQVDYPLISNIPAGIVSGSVQVDYPLISNIPAGIVSGSVITLIVGGTDIDANTVGGVTTIDNTMVTGSVARTDVNNTFSGNQTFNDITVNGTGSFAYISSVTGSAKTIGDAFIQLNNDTPTQRYAGLKVLDSGSANTTASLQFDGQTNDWFFEKEVSGVAEFGVSLFGPEYTSIGVPTYNANNKIPKGTGGHHLNDSNITDNGTTITLGSDTNVTGVLSATTISGMISGSSQVDYPQISNIPSGIVSGSVVTSIVAGTDITITPIGGTGAVTVNSTAISSLPTGIISGSSQVDYPQISNIPAGIVSGSTQILDGSGILSSSATDFATYTASQEDLNLTFATTGSNTFTGSQIINGNTTSNGVLTQNFSAPIANQENALVNMSGALVNGKNYNRTFFGIADYPSYGTQFEDYFSIEYYDSVSYNFGSDIALNGSGLTLTTQPSGSGFNSRATITTIDNYNGTANISINARNGSTNIDGTSIQITGPTTLNGSFKTAVQTITPNAGTAVIDFSLASLFKVTLDAGSVTTFDASNIGVGQTINLLITQNASTAGTIAFDSKFKQPDGSPYVATTDLGAQDILTLITYTSTSDIYVVATNKFV